MKTIGRYVVVALIALAVGVIASSKWFKPEPIIETITVTDTIVKTVIEETPVRYVNGYTKPKPITITVPDNTTIVPDDSVSVATRKYEGKEILDNGTVDYEIYADSLYAYKFKLETKETTITKYITNNITKPTRSRLFVTGGLDVGLDDYTKPTAAEAGLLYNRRQKWGVGVVIRHDFSGLLPPQQATSVGLRVHIGL